MHTILNRLDGDTDPGIFVGTWINGRTYGSSFHRLYKCPNLAAALSLVHFLNGGADVGITATVDSKFAITPYGDCEAL